MSTPPVTGRWGCDRCWPTSPEAAWAGRSGLTAALELVDESHLGISLATCPACGQHFASIFEEEVDWSDGDDPQYWTIVPLTNIEALQFRNAGPRVTQGDILRVGTGRRTLHRDYPKGADPRLYWRGPAAEGELS